MYVHVLKYINIFGYINKKVPISDVPGEKTAIYQKIFSLPEPFSNQYFQKSHITNLSEERFKFVKDKIEGSTYGFFVPKDGWLPCQVGPKPKTSE